MTRRPRGDGAHLVTEARRPRSEDIAYRERRYLIMMAIRVACFGIAILLFTQGAGWVAAIPVVGALIIPYFAVVFANSGREPTSTRGVRAYEPRLPAAYPPAERNHTGPSGPNQTGQSAPNAIDRTGQNHNGDSVHRDAAEGGVVSPDTDSG